MMKDKKKFYKEIEEFVENLEKEIEMHTKDIKESNKRTQKLLDRIDREYPKKKTEKVNQ